MSSGSSSSSAACCWGSLAFPAAGMALTVSPMMESSTLLISSSVSSSMSSVSMALSSVSLIISSISPARIISLLISTMVRCSSGSLMACVSADMTCVDFCSACDTRSTASCSTSWLLMDMSWALLVYSCPTVLRVCTTCLASTRTDAWSPRLAASLMLLTTFFSSNWMSRTCRSKARCSERNVACHFRTMTLGSSSSPRASLTRCILSEPIVT
mmetsp:Transcript_28281/g.72118  ORF Transcript_28281/g.72118 Transcript_28281/m.72118 type:complete len:213 (-) Transcript_28281:96-734(-)